MSLSNPHTQVLPSVVCQMKLLPLVVVVVVVMCVVTARRTCKYNRKTEGNEAGDRLNNYRFPPSAALPRQSVLYPPTLQEDTSALRTHKGLLGTASRTLTADQFHRLVGVTNDNGGKERMRVDALVSKPSIYPSRRPLFTLTEQEFHRLIFRPNKLASVKFMDTMRNKNVTQGNPTSIPLRKTSTNLNKNESPGPTFMSVLNLRSRNKPLDSGSVRKNNQPPCYGSDAKVMTYHTHTTPSKADIKEQLDLLLYKMEDLDILRGKLASLLQSAAS